MTPFYLCPLCVESLFITQVTEMNKLNNFTTLIISLFYVFISVFFLHLIFYTRLFLYFSIFIKFYQPKKNHRLMIFLVNLTLVFHYKFFDLYCNFSMPLFIF